MDPIACTSRLPQHRGIDMAISLSRLNQALHNDTIIRTRIDLQPLSGDGLVYPPTYDKGKHIFRKGFVDGECA